MRLVYAAPRVVYYSRVPWADKHFYTQFKLKWKGASLMRGVLSNHCRLDEGRSCRTLGELFAF